MRDGCMMQTALYSCQSVAVPGILQTQPHAKVSCMVGHGSAAKIGRADQTFYDNLTYLSGDAGAFGENPCKAAESHGGGSCGTSAS